MRMRLLTLMLGMLSITALSEIRPESFSVGALKVIHVYNPATDIVAANMYYRGGVGVAGIDKAGIEHLALLVATRATKNYPADKMSAALERMDTRLSSASGPDYSSVNMQCVKKNLGESWKILTDVILNPSFDSTIVEHERQQTLAALRQVSDNPDQYLNKLSIENFYRENPYSVDPAGTERTVRSFTRRDLQAYMQSRDSASQMLLVVCGNVQRNELEQMVKASFGKLPAGSFKTLEPVPIRHNSPLVIVSRRELPTNYIMGLFPAPPFASPESYAMAMARSILGDRLFEEVRTKRSLSYAPAAVAGSMFSSYAGIYVTAVKPETTITVMVDELKKLQQEPVPAKTLNDKKNMFFTGYYMGVETNASQADVLARYELSGKGYEQGTKLMENVRRVTAQDIQKVCNEYIHNLQFVLIGNPMSLQLSPFMY